MQSLRSLDHFTPDPSGTLSPLEVRIVRLAARSPRERRSVDGAAARAAALADRMTGRRTPRALGDPRLEALRDQAVASRDGAEAVQPGFVAAGYSLAQAATVATLVRVTRNRSTPAARRDRTAYATGLTLALGSMLCFIGLTGAMMVQP